MQQRGMAHVALKSSDWQRSLDFYTRICGFDIRHRWRMPNGAHAAMLSAPDGGAMLELFDAAADVPAQGRRAEPGEEPVQGALLHLAFRVDDVDAAYEAALAWGAPSRRAPTRQPPGSPPSPHRAPAASSANTANARRAASVTPGPKTGAGRGPRANGTTANAAASKSRPSASGSDAGGGSSARRAAASAAGRVQRRSGTPGPAVRSRPSAHVSWTAVSTA